MEYRCTECGHSEVLWNSRDGVTPFIISCQACSKAAHHVNWHQDVQDPFFEPPRGMRIFVDLTPEMNKEHQMSVINKYWYYGKSPMRNHFASKDVALAALCNNFIEGQPAIIEHRGE